MASKSLEQLLKSSLPLEQHVAEVAFENGLISGGEFPYLRKTDAGVDTEFSVDILATASYVPNSDVEASIEVNALIECKYASPNVEWVFSTAPNHEPPYYSSISVFNWLSPHILEDVKLLNQIEPADYCIKGVSLSETSADPKPIKHGLQQLRHAIPRLLDRVTTLYTSIYDEHPIPVVAPMLVTNAPIRLLKAGITIDEIKQSNSIEEITQPRDLVCCYQPAGPELLEICQAVSEKIATKYYSGKAPHSSASIFDDLVKSVESVPVISVKRLDSYLKGIRNAFTNTEATRVADFYAKYVSLGRNDDDT
jgi:hypothetical protein